MLRALLNDAAFRRINVIGRSSTSKLGHDLPAWPLDVFVAIANLGAALAIPALTSGVLGHGDGQHTNTAAAVLNANRQIGALVGVAAVDAVLHGTTSWSLKLPACLALLAIAFVRQTQKMFSEGASSGASAA